MTETPGRVRCRTARPAEVPGRSGRSGPCGNTSSSLAADAAVHPNIQRPDRPHRHQGRADPAGTRGVDTLIAGTATFAATFSPPGSSGATSLAGWFRKHTFLSQHGPAGRAA